jgi:hypothetical protein
MEQDGQTVRFDVEQEFAPMVRELLSLLRRRLGAGAPHVASSNLFRLQGAGWHVRFGGREFFCPDQVGMVHLSNLMRRPFESIPCPELEAAGQPPESLRLTSLSEPILDDQARSEYRQRLKDIEAELAEVADDHDRVVALQNERDQIVAELDANRGLGGRPRRFTDEIERSRLRVCGAIRRALSMIARHDQDLARHLRDSLDLGKACIYSPAEPPEWKF